MITLVCGPMFSGKTTQLLVYERRSLIAKQKVVYIKHSADNRYSFDKVVINHDGSKSSESVPVVSTTKLMDCFDVVKDFDVILIEEGQFFPDLFSFCESLLNKSIVISALSGDYKRKPFQPVTEILGLCDKIVHLCATCVCCGKDAPFTKRLTSNTDQILIGGKDSYEPRCGSCF